MRVIGGMLTRGAPPAFSASVCIEKVQGGAGSPLPREEGAIQMMDHERTEKELEQIFGEIQHSYETLVGNAFALQERTLELARTLFERAPEDAQGTRDVLEEMADEARIQREAFEKLVRKSNEAYTTVLRAPFDEHHHKMEEGRTDLKEASSS
jgi:hypothetical protein